MAKKHVGTDVTYLVCSADEIKVIVTKEVADYLVAELERDTAIIGTPTFRVLKKKN